MPASSSGEGASQVGKSGLPSPAMPSVLTDNNCIFTWVVRDKSRTFSHALISLYQGGPTVIAQGRWAVLGDEKSECPWNLTSTERLSMELQSRNTSNPQPRNFGVFKYEQEEAKVAIQVAQNTTLMLQNRLVSKASRTSVQHHLF